jgi:endogenous inhibitor of DNA gyrase (YacG/DUF329 family)
MKAMSDTVSVYPCCNCGKMVIVEKGNYHPYCSRCMDDQFDWNSGYHDISRKEAEEIKERGY